MVILDLYIYITFFPPGLDCLSQISVMIKALMTPNTDSEMANLLKITEANSSEMKIVLKVMKRRLPGGVTKSDLSPTEPMIRFDENSLKVPFIYYECLYFT